MLTQRWFKIWRNWTAKEDSPAEVTRRELEDKRAALETAEETLAQRDEALAQAQGELDQERRRYQELFDLAPQAYLETDENGLIREVNQAAAVFLQKPARFLRGIPLVLFVAANARIPFYDLVAKLRQSKNHKTEEYQFQMQQVDGRLFDVVVSVRAIHNDQGRMSLHWMLNDVTARRRVETALQAAHESLLHHVKRQSAELAVVKATMTEEWEVRTAELAETHASLAQEVAERQRVEQEIVRRNRELAALNRVSSALNGSLELPTVLRILKASLVESLEVDGGLVYLYDESRRHFWLHDSWGVSEAMGARIQYLDAAELTIEAIVGEKEMIFPELALLAAGRPDCFSFLFLPLVTQRDVQGAICLCSVAPAVFGEESAIFFENLGQQVAVAIQNARLYEQVSEGRERLRQLTQQIVRIQENERHRVSRELHDEAGQALMVLKFSLELILSDLLSGGVDGAKAASLRRQLVEVLDLCETTMARIRRLAHNLRPAALDDLGLNAALEGLCHDFAERSRLTIEYEGDEIDDLPGGVDISLYRFLQEALTNVVKHAQAERAWVKLSFDEDLVVLSVQDDGQGFATSSAGLPGRANGMGLAGVRERLQPLGGRLEIHSTPGEGTTLVAYVPR
jgi:PAS domain S-box-containing protein